MQFVLLYRDSLTKLIHVWFYFIVIIIASLLIHLYLAAADSSADVCSVRDARFLEVKHERTKQNENKWVLWLFRNQHQDLFWTYQTLPDPVYI